MKTTTAKPMKHNEKKKTERPIEIGIFIVSNSKSRSFLTLKGIVSTFDTALEISPKRSLLNLDMIKILKVIKRMILLNIKKMNLNISPHILSHISTLSTCIFFKKSFII
jgi:hypothetical protein